MNISFVLYDPTTGDLLGGFMQAAPDDGMPYFVVDDYTRMNWFNYRMNSARDGLELIPLPPPPPPVIPDYVSAVQSMLDTKVQERYYDNILSACTYALSTNPKFQAEGKACVAWRDAAWTKCYELLELVNTNVQPQPTVAEVLDMIPPLVWPE